MQEQEPEEQEQVVVGAPGSEPALAPLYVHRAAGRLRGAGGEEQVDPKVMQVFGVLLDRQGEVVPREDLFAAAWPAATVTDEALTRCIYALRGHLERAGGDAAYRQLLETLPKRGYRLNASIARAPAGPEVARAARRRTFAPGAAVIAAALVLAALAWFVAGRPGADGGDSNPTEAAAGSAEPALTLAVLPFTDMSPDGSEQYFADGLTEELINRLANTLDARVIARTSSFSFRDSNADIATIAERLGVTHVLEGSVRRSGDVLRITAQLIDAADSGHVWSQSYDTGHDDAFAVQDRIAAEVVAALRAELPAVTKAAAARTPSPEAHEALLRGRFFYQRRSPGDVGKALSFFEAAARADPGYAEAWVGIAAACNLLQWDEGADAATMMAKRREAVQRALELDPSLAEAHARAAQYYFDAGEGELAQVHARKAIDLDPDHELVLGMQASRAGWEGNFAEAARLLRGALVRDPLSTAIVNNLAINLLADGRPAEAERELMKIDGLTVDAATHFPKLFADALILQQRYDEALALVESWPEGADRDQYLALVYSGLDRDAEAGQALSRLDGLPPLERRLRRAEVLAFRGDTDAALAELDVPPEWQWPSTGAIPGDIARRARYSAYLNGLDDPRWDALWQST